MRWKIRHETHYLYTLPLQYLIQHLRLTPDNSLHQQVHQWQVSAPSALEAGIDAFANQQHTLSLMRPVSSVSLSAGGEVELRLLADGLLPQQANALSPLVFSLATCFTAVDESVETFAHQQFEQAFRRCDWLEMTHQVRQAVRYQPGKTAVNSTAAQVLELGLGVCQDHAHVFIAACRVLQLPCRYVSGYFYPGERDEQASHAWVDVWSEQGWRSLDVTHGEFASQRHVRLAVGRDYESAAPVRGVRMGGGDEIMTVKVSIAPV